MHLLEDSGADYTNIKEKGNGYLVKLKNEWETQKMLELSGETVGRCTIRITRTDIHMSTRAIFKLVGDHLRVKEEAISRRKGVSETHRRVHSTEIEEEKKPKISVVEPEKKVVKTQEKSVVQFKPQSHPSPNVSRGNPMPKAWESHPSSIGGGKGSMPTLRGRGTTASSTWNAAAVPGWSGPQGSWQAGPPNPQSNPQWTAGPSPPGQWSVDQSRGKGYGKGNTYTQSGKGNGPDKVGNPGKGGTMGKGGAHVLAASVETTQPVSRAGRKCGFCHEQGRDGNHDFLTCRLRAEGQRKEWEGQE